MTSDPRTDPLEKARDDAHTELRRVPADKDGKSKLKPRAKQERIDDIVDDGTDDLFNDMPV